MRHFWREKQTIAWCDKKKKRINRKNILKEGQSLAPH
jgi:hypothetical protein